VSRERKRAKTDRLDAAMLMRVFLGWLPRKTTMIVALARKLLIALWRLVTTGEIPDGVELRPVAGATV
jgi:hypothetical protein